MNVKSKKPQSNIFLKNLCKFWNNLNYIIGDTKSKPFIILKDQWIV